MQLLDIHGKSSASKVGPDLLMLGAHAHTRVQLLLLTSAMLHNMTHSDQGRRVVERFQEYGICQEWVVQLAL